MKKLLKITVIAVAIVSVLAAFTACGQKDETIIKFGTNAEFAPFEFINNEGGIIDNFDGIDIAIAKQIGEDCEKETIIESIEFDSLLVALQNGQIDAAISGMTVTEERKEAVDFSVPYYTATQVMIVRNDSSIKTAKDMADKKIAVVQGYTGETCVKKMGYEYDAFKKGSECVLELRNGKCDVVVIDSATAKKYIADNPELKIVEDSTTFEAEEYAVAVKKGNQEILDEVNKTVQKMLDDGSIDKLIAEYCS